MSEGVRDEQAVKLVVRKLKRRRISHGSRRGKVQVSCLLCVSVIFIPEREAGDTLEECNKEF